MNKISLALALSLALIGAQQTVTRAVSPPAQEPLLTIELEEPLGEDGSFVIQRGPPLPRPDKITRFIVMADRRVDYIPAGKPRPKQQFQMSEADLAALQKLLADHRLPTEGVVQLSRASLAGTHLSTFINRQLQAAKKSKATAESRGAQDPE